MKNSNVTIKIEKRIKLPAMKWAKPNLLTIVMKKMKNGDSFLYPLCMRAHLSFAAKKAKIVISTRTVDEKTVRCWRIQERRF